MLKLQTSEFLRFLFLRSRILAYGIRSTNSQRTPQVSPVFAHTTRRIRSLFDSLGHVQDIRDIQAVRGDLPCGSTGVSSGIDGRRDQVKWKVRYLVLQASIEIKNADFPFAPGLGNRTALFRQHTRERTSDRPRCNVSQRGYQLAVPFP